MGTKKQNTGLSIERAHRIAAAWQTATSMEEAMRMAGITAKDGRTLRRYRRMTEELLDTHLEPHNPHKSPLKRKHPRALSYDRHDEAFDVVVFSDAHWWPGMPTSPANDILLQVIEEIQPAVIVDGGDSLDGASISRHPPNGWEHRPTLADEIATVQSRLHDIHMASPGSELYRMVGNHDLRFEMYLAQRAPEMREVVGTKISDLFPGWEHTWSMYINDCVKIKHRWKSGIHASRNNAVGAGISHVTGHTHRLTCRGVSDERGTHYGAESGTLADPHGPQFEYTEHNTVDWQPGFLVIHFWNTRHIIEPVHVEDGSAFFRGEWWESRV